LYFETGCCFLLARREGRIDHRCLGLEYLGIGLSQDAASWVSVSVNYWEGVGRWIAEGEDW